MKQGIVWLTVGAICVLSTAAWGGYVDNTDELPSPTYEGDEIYVSNYTYDGLDRRIRTQAEDIFTRLPPPPPDTWVESFFDIIYRIEFDDGTGGGFVPWEVPTLSEMRVIALPWDGVDPLRQFHVEILSLELVCPYDPDIILQADPAASGGPIAVTDLGSGLYNIDSFFDISFKLSMHGPAGPWESPLDGPQHLVGIPEPATVALLALGGLALAARRVGGRLERH
jgi:hypothetical protein